MSGNGKFGDGHASAMFRQGLRELRGAMYPNSNVAQTPEYGLYGTKTPGEVADDRRGDESDRSILQEKLRELDRDDDERGDDPRDLDRDD